ncbi:MAG: hypothetical protein IKE20_01540, partial [Eggerthellaceae bacterium]|nr:hypothetical protein [Eggerthellaceae bacterium]
ATWANAKRKLCFHAIFERNLLNLLHFVKSDPDFCASSIFGGDFSTYGKRSTVFRIRDGVFDLAQGWTHSVFGT